MLFLEKEEIDKLNCDDNHNLRETSLIDDKLIASVVDKKQEKSDIAKRRPRTTLAATPMLEEIPEEKGHGSGSDTNIAVVSDEARITGKRARKQVLFLSLLAKHSICICCYLASKGRF